MIIIYLGLGLITGYILTKWRKKYIEYNKYIEPFRGHKYIIKAINELHKFNIFVYKDKWVIKYSSIDESMKYEMVGTLDQIEKELMDKVFLYEVRDKKLKELGI